jgi:hypothetical protein
MIAFERGLGAGLTHQPLGGDIDLLRRHPRHDERPQVREHTGHELIDAP